MAFQKKLPTLLSLLLNPQIIGWREWLALPTLEIPRIKCKVDTGARTSALHAEQTERFDRDGKPWVRYFVYPLQRQRTGRVVCESEVIGERVVADSGGHRELRLVVTTEVCLGDQRFPIELTLTDRESLRFRMLLGRTALVGRYIVDPKRSYLAGDPITDR